MAKCPVEGCGSGDEGQPYETNSKIKMYQHVYAEHEDTYSRDDLKAMVGDLKFATKSSGKGKRSHSGGNMSTTDNDEIGGIDNLDEVNQLKNILSNNGVRKAGAIANLFQYHDLDDLSYLERIMKKAGTQPNTRSLVLETWAASRGLDEDEVEAVQVSSKKKQRHSDDDDDDMSDYDDILGDLAKEGLKRAKAEMKKRQVAQQLMDAGLNPEDYGLPAIKPKDKDTKVTDDDDKIEVEWPPDSGATKKMTPERYNALLLGWNRAHGKTKSDDDDEKPKKEQTIPWVDPYNNQTIQVPVSQYKDYLAINDRYNREHEARENPEITRLHDDIKAIKEKKDNEIEQLKNYIMDKEKQDMNGQIGGLAQKNKELEDKLDAYEKRDPLDTYAEARQKLYNNAERFGLAPAQMTVQEQNSLKKMDMQVDTISRAANTVANKIDKNQLGTGMIVDKLLNNFGDSLGDAVKDRIRNSRGRNGPSDQSVDPSEQEMAQMQTQLDNSGGINSDIDRENLSELLPLSEMYEPPQRTQELTYTNRQVKGHDINDDVGDTPNTDSHQKQNSDENHKAKGVKKHNNHGGKRKK